MNNKNFVRIIGGKWRSRILHFPAIEGLRPTPDRVRETLFNWLAPYIVDARCLDVFAGSGALGFEALSRGAKSVTMIDQSSPVMRYLQENAKRLTACDQILFYCGQIPDVIIPNHANANTSSFDSNKFDIVFLDPPFHQNWIPICIQWLEKLQCLTDHALIYIEAESELQPLPISTQWDVLRSKKAGQVGYHLIQRRTTHDE